MNTQKRVAGRPGLFDFSPEQTRPHADSPSGDGPQTAANLSALFLAFRSLQAILLALSLTACSLGRMELREVHYYAVPDGKNTNYFRLKVYGDTVLGNAQYRSGWFPAKAVDSLFGDVTADDNASAYETRRALETQIREKVLATYKAWLDEASKPDPDKAKLAGLMEARRLVLAYPAGDGAPFPGTVEIQYNPAEGIAILRADEKLVFVLGSNPDEVLGKIANFAESEKTVSSVNQLGRIISERVKADVAAEEAAERVNQQANALIASQISSTLKVLESGATKAEAGKEIDTLLSVINAVRP
jgi:hypothetical protein